MSVYRVQFRDYNEGYSRIYDSIYDTYDQARKFIEDELDSWGVARTWTNSKSKVCYIGDNTSFKILKMENA